MLNLLPMLGDIVPKMEVGDAAIIARPVDFLGVNYYYRTIIHHPANSPPGDYEVVKPGGAEYTDMGWEVYPRGLYKLLTRFHKEYAIPEM